MERLLQLQLVFQRTKGFFQLPRVGIERAVHVHRVHPLLNLRRHSVKLGVIRRVEGEGKLGIHIPAQPCRVGVHNALLALAINVRLGYNQSAQKTNARRIDSHKGQLLYGRALRILRVFIRACQRNRIAKPV